MATAKVRPEESGLASGLVNSAQQVGGAVGLAALAVVAASRTSHVLAQAGGTPSASQTAQALTLGFERGFVIAGIIVAVGAVVATAAALSRFRRNPFSRRYRRYRERQPQAPLVPSGTSETRFR